ncbi:hypothetical protein C2G38_2111413 [Gigaspora rosea]|uniref:Uncharacterized protein n=1 Tax=Gigaspora rosea TaxID=44941 RepID=A0A397UFC3_9GLOM|nr:hypothetical protein C2G38_2111413 [Gigaspora rosea]
MASIIPGVGDHTTRDIVLKRPYHNEEEFYAKHQRIKRQRIKISFLPIRFKYKLDHRDGLKTFI